MGFTLTAEHELLRDSLADDRGIPGATLPKHYFTRLTAFEYEFGPADQHRIRIIGSTGLG